MILYSTGEGQTLKIGQYVGFILEHAANLKITYLNANLPLPQNFSCTDYQAIILGSSLRYRRYSDAIGNFTFQHKDCLQRVPSAFYSVSLADIKHPSSWVGWLIDQFLKTNEWKPDVIGRFGGALRYTQFQSKWERRGMVFGAVMSGYSTDTSCDHEYTNWGMVDEFAREVLDKLRRVYEVRVQR